MKQSTNYDSTIISDTYDDNIRVHNETYAYGSTFRVLCGNTPTNFTHTVWAISLAYACNREVTLMNTSTNRQYCPKGINATTRNHGDIEMGNIGPDKRCLPDDTKTLPEPMFIICEVQRQSLEGNLTLDTLVINY